MAKLPLYDDLSADYDRFVDWPARLAFEMPFLKALFAEHGIQRLLDVACGTGMHAIALAQEGLSVAATDLSDAMVASARQNARAAGVDVQVHALGLEDLGTMGETFDAVTCLGNSLPHVTTTDGLSAVIQGVHHVLRPGGLFVVQMRNFCRVLERRERFMPLETHSDDGEDWLFLRFYDWLPEGLHFNVVRMHRSHDGAWDTHTGHTMLYPWRADELTRQFVGGGLEIVSLYGSLRRHEYQAAESSDLVIVAQRKAGDDD